MQGISFLCWLSVSSLIWYVLFSNSSPCHFLAFLPWWIVTKTSFSAIYFLWAIEQHASPSDTYIPFYLCSYDIFLDGVGHRVLTIAREQIIPSYWRCMRIWCVEIMVTLGGVREGVEARHLLMWSLSPAVKSSIWDFSIWRATFIAMVCLNHFWSCVFFFFFFCEDFSVLRLCNDETIFHSVLLLQTPWR